MKIMISQSFAMNRSCCPLAGKERNLYFVELIETKKSVYMKKLLLPVLLCCNILLHAQQMNFEQTRALIKKTIACCAIPFLSGDSMKVSGIEIQKNGDVQIFYSSKKGPLAFNLFDLYSEGGDDKGIQTGIGNSRLLLFNLNPEKTRTIRFATHEDAKKMEAAFTRLLQLCSRRSHDSSVTDFPSPDLQSAKPEGALYFINRRAIVHTSNNMLLNSIRSADKKDVGDTTLLVMSSGEGWLDKDSLPIGDWQFFTTDASGREYVFKKGSYSRTRADMFEVLNSDSNWLMKNHQVSFASLKENHSVLVPFIKSDNWEYYHPNGRIWKTVGYQSRQVPVYLDIMISTDPLGNETGSTIITRSKEDADEWIARDVKEYDQNGILFKKLEYYSFSEVFKKTIYGPKGEIIKEEKAKPYESIVDPNNF